MLTIRSLRADDLDDLYRISLATGLAGGDASHLYVDPRLMGHIYSAPYAELEPQLAFVIEDQDGVAGFAVGAIDTAAWEERLESEWWPVLRAQYAMPSESDASASTPDQRRIAMIHRPTRTPPAVTKEFPAHLHLNLLPRLHGRGVGTALFKHWRAAASEAGAQAMHVAVNRTNVGANRFWVRMGFKVLTVDGSAEGRTVWMGRR